MFSPLEWTKKWFKASFETFIKTGDANIYLQWGMLICQKYNSQISNLKTSKNHQN